MQPLVWLDRVCRCFRMDHASVPALNDVSLEVRSGEFMAVAGPSGSGKSTLLHLIGCLDRTTAGEIWFEGEKVSETSPAKLASLRRSKIGFVFQTFNLIPVFTAAENVEYPLLLRRMSRAERLARVRDALACVGLEGRKDQRPDLLSGGERH